MTHSKSHWHCEDCGLKHECERLQDIQEAKCKRCKFNNVDIQEQFQDEISEEQEAEKEKASGVKYIFSSLH